MTDLPLQQLPNQPQIQRKLVLAEFHRERLSAVTSLQTAPGLIAAEAHVSATIDQLLEALHATLHGFNLLLPDPLPPLRVNRKNLRDQFHAVQGDSAALRAVEDAARVNQGWLWWLEQKAAAAAFFPLLATVQEPDGETLRLWRNPLNRTAGYEVEPPASYLAASAELMEFLIHEVARLAHADVAHYREAARGQLRRLF